MAAFNLILSNLKKIDFEKTDIYSNFFFNICVPLYQENEKNEDNKLFEFNLYLIQQNIIKLKKIMELILCILILSFMDLDIV